jgi:opacity protein-like surface antigen
VGEKSLEVLARKISPVFGLPDLDHKTPSYIIGENSMPLSETPLNATTVVLTASADVAHRFLVGLLNPKSFTGRNTRVRKTLSTLCLVFLASLPALAQEVPKADVFGGYSWAGGNFHGWNASVTGNITKRFGIVADFSGHYGSEIDGPLLVNENAHSFLVGPRFTFRGKRVSPFVYTVFGVTRFHASATVSGQRLSDTDTGFSSAVGGGLDIKLNDRVAVRAFQIDYFRPNFFGEAHNRGRLAFGLVINLGKH